MITLSITASALQEYQKKVSVRVIENIFDKIMAEIFPDMVKKNGIQVKEVHRV